MANNNSVYKSTHNGVQVDSGVNKTEHIGNYRAYDQQMYSPNAAGDNLYYKKIDLTEGAYYSDLRSGVIYIAAVRDNNPTELYAKPIFALESTDDWNTWKEYLRNNSFQAPKIAVFKVLDNNQQPLQFRYEKGTTGIVAKSIQHSEDNPNSLTSLVFRTTNYSDQTIAKSSTSQIVPLNSDINVDDSRTFLLEGTYSSPSTQSTETISANYVINFETFAYSSITTSTTVPTSGDVVRIGPFNKEANIAEFEKFGEELSYTEGDYIYFYTTVANGKVQTWAMGQWGDTTSTPKGSVIGFTQDNGQVVNYYYAYCTGPMIGSGTARYRVVANDDSIGE